MRRVLLVAVAVLAVSGGACYGQRTPPADNYCYYNERTTTWRLGNAAVERTIQFDREAGTLRTVSVRTKGKAPRIVPVSALEGEIAVTRPDGSASSLRLDGDWVFMFQIVSRPPHMGRRLTIHLQGKGRNAGYQLEAVYEVLPGRSPFFLRGLTLINRTGAPVKVGTVRFDRWVVPAPEGRGAYTGKTEIVHAVLDGSAPVIAAGESVSLALEANAEVPPDRRYMSPLVAVAAAPPDAAAHDALVKSLEGVR